MAVPGDSAQYRVYTFRHGTRETRRSEVFLDYAAYGEADGAHVVDYYFWLVRNDERAILVDTGFAADVAERRGRVVLHDPVEMLEAHAGIRPEDIDTIVVTHCHYDHIGNLARFPNARVHVAEQELEFAFSGVLDRRLVGHYTEPHEVAEFERLRGQGRLVTVHDETDIAPGVRLIPVGGHTPGQLMLEVDTASGPVLLASDALHFFEELERDMPFISSMDLPATYRTFDLIRARRDSSARHLVPGHDAQVFATMTPVADDVGVLG
ncbi:N-acyl homoserine lactonase family protein [Microbacterium sp. GXF7504]